MLFPITTHFVVEMVSSMLGLLCNSPRDALQAVAFCQLFFIVFEVLVAMMSNGALLLMNKVLELTHLPEQVVQLG